MAVKAEDDLFALAAQGGTEETGKETGLSVGPIFLEPESEERRGINQRGDDPGFETRVKAPSGVSSRRKVTGGSGETGKDAPKKAVGRPRGSATERSIEEISSALEQKFAEFFGYISLGLPVTGVYGTENSDKAVKALISIGKRRPAVMKVLMKMADGADGMDIGKFAMGLVVAVQVDMQRIQGDVLIARATGVTAVIEKYFIDEEQPVNQNVTGQATYATTRFQPVS